MKCDDAHKRMSLFDFDDPPGLSSRPSPGQNEHFVGLFTVLAWC